MEKQIELIHEIKKYKKTFQLNHLFLAAYVTKQLVRINQLIN